MADPILNINQGDTIYFYDTSTGNVVSWDWEFQGGTPSTATTQNVYVTFNSPNTGGYTASLTVTDAAGISASKAKDNIISVEPETINSLFSITSNTRLMSQSQTYISGATASSGISSYNWNIPGLGSTSGSSLNAFSYTEDNWFNVAGTYLGSPNSTVLTTASLTINSNVGNSSTSNNNVTYYKMGSAEYYSLDNIGLTGPYYDVSYLNSSGSLGLGGASLVFSIDQSTYGATASFINQYFHSTNEVFYFVPNSTDLVKTVTPSLIRMKSIIDKSAWDLARLTYTSDDAFSSGSYILPEGSRDVLDNKLCITDYTTTSPNTLTNLNATKGWGISDIVEFLNNTHYSSSSSKFIENWIVFPTGKELLSSSIAGYNWTGGYSFSGYYPGILVPSSYFFATYYGSGIIVSLSASVYNTSGVLLENVTVTLSSAGALGNSPDGFIMTTNNTPHGTRSGIAKIINDALNISNFSGNFLVESGTSYTAYHQQTSDYFPGMRISIIDPANSYYEDNIGYISINWSTSYLTALAGFRIDDSSPLLNSFTSDTGISFTGIRNTACSLTPSNYRIRRGWIIGGEIG